MKRLRDDDCVNSQFKRPFGSSRGESYYGEPQIQGGGGTVKKLTTTDALAYLKEVKDMFQDQQEKYGMFLEVMKDFKSQRIDTDNVIARVKELFEGHNNLIIGFNTFLPKGYQITSIDEEKAPPRKTVQFEEAINFVNKIKGRFQNDDRVYKAFLDILNSYRKEHKGIGEVYREVAALFERHPDLFDEFKLFLPVTSATPLHFQSVQHSYNHYEGRCSDMTTLRRPYVDKQRGRRDRTVSLQADHDINVEHPDLDDDITMMKLHKDQRKRVEKENRDRKNRDQGCRGHAHDSHGDFNMHHLPDKSKFSQKVEDYGSNPVLSSCDDKDAVKSLYNKEFVFCESVKDRLRNTDDYQAFLKCLHMYSTEIITRKELQILVSDLLGKYQDLMDGFNEFLERCENIDQFLAGVMNKKSLWKKGYVNKPVKVEEKDKEQKNDMNGAREKDRFKEKYMGKSIQELDLSNCQRCTPSYRLLPEDYPIPSVSQRSELGAQVLNDRWVSVTSGSEDYSFKHMRRNQYEESLFRCEDDRFELDMLLESVSSTVTRTEALWNSINDNSIDPQSSIHIEEHFTAVNLRCIERLYGDHGLDVIEVLKKNPPLSLPVILTRLKQKKEEWTKCRADFNKVWAEIYAKNHHKSLDHRSFYFKQQDSKTLSTNSLVTEIKEIKYKRQKEDNMLLGIAAGSRHSVTPDLEFEYFDTEIHEDMYNLVKYSCEEVCSTKEQLNKVMRLWTLFLEPLLGVPCQSRDLEGTEEVGKLSHYAPKNTLVGTGERDGSMTLDAATLTFEQSEPVGSGDKSSSQDPLISLAKENALCFDKEQKKTTSLDEVCEFGSTTGPAERLIDFNASNDAGTDTNCSRITMEMASGCGTSQPNGTGVKNDHEPEVKIDDVPLSEGDDMSTPIPLASVEVPEGSKVNCYQNEFIKPNQMEKEEGELSPNGDFEEDNFVYGGDGSPQAISKTKSTVADAIYPAENVAKTCSQDSGGENNVDADDEDSDNVSEAGEDVSGSSESAADECSREEMGDEDDGDHDEHDDVKVESEVEADHIIEEGDSPSLPQPESILETAKPLAKYVSSASHNIKKKDSRVFYGNDGFYVLFRFHQILYERLLSAKRRCTEMKCKTAKDGSHPDLYARFMRALYNLVDGTVDNAKFEDDCRTIIGNYSYVLFTMDKLIYKLVKQLQTVSSDEIDNKLLQLYEYEKSRKSDKFVDSVYHDNAHVLFHDENVYRFQCQSSTPLRLSIQLMDDGNEKPEVVPVFEDPNFVSYLQNDFLSPAKKEPRGIMLRRNKRKYADLDEASAISMATEGAHVLNGLECKMACNSSKISYVLDTEDSFFRTKRNKKLKGSSSLACLDRSRVQRFHRFLTAALSPE